MGVGSLLKRADILRGDVESKEGNYFFFLILSQAKLPPRMKHY